MERTAFITYLISPFLEALRGAGVLPPGTLVRAIDISNHQPVHKTAEYINQFQAGHVIVKMYQTVEVPGSRNHAKGQAAIALENGCTVGGYLWVYSNVNAQQQVGDALSLAQEMGVTLPILWLDIETYQNSLPSVAQIQACVDACDAAGMKCGIYTGKWVWDLLGNPIQFSHLPLWHAAYDNRHELIPVNYGGWTICQGHQYTSTPIDQNVFDSVYTQVA
jgi:GH25 family lysozyme M1 (1,4-beta-N-acetylmuramidase)